MPIMEHKGNNNTSNSNGSTSNNNVDNTQRDNNNTNKGDFYTSQSEPPGTSLPGSSTSTPLVTSPFHEPLVAPVTTTSPTSSTNLNLSPPAPSTNSNTATTTSTTTTIATTTTTTPAAAHKTQAAFVNKLYTMVEDQSIQHLISWAPTGDVFSVSNPTEFSKSVLPQYFKHNNWQSFVRQLNMYGFHKVNDMFHANPTSESQAWEFKHPDFRRGQLLALQNIKRKSSKPANPNNMKGIPGSSGTGQSPSADTDTRDDRIDCLTTQMSEMMDRMRQMSESYSLLYAETVSCRMLQSKHQQVITAITNLLASMSREDDNNDPRSLKRKFDMDLLTAEVAKLGQVDVPPPSHSPMMQHQSHYPREHPIRSMSTPQPMVGLEPTHSAMNEIEYRMRSSSPFGPNHHNQQSKVQTSSPLAMLPEIPFSPFQPSNNYLRHRSPEPISGVSPANSRSTSMDTYSRSVSMSQSNSQTASQYSQTNSHSSHMSPSSLPSPPTRRSSQPASSLGFGSDSNLLNPSDNRYKDNNSSTISQSQSQQLRPPSSSSTSPIPFKSENPVVNNPSTSQTRAPPIPDPPDNGEEYAKRRKRN